MVPESYRAAAEQEGPIAADALHSAVRRQARMLWIFAVKGSGRACRGYRRQKKAPEAPRRFGGFDGMGSFSGDQIVIDGLTAGEK